MYSLFSVALLPVVLLALVVFRQDKDSPEPIGWLVLGFVYGIISLFLSFTISFPLQWLGVYPATTASVMDGILKSFFGAAIPEELAKLFMLWLLLHWNKHFDEKLDGIVYAVCITLGFAALENIMYLIQSDNWVATGILRALSAVPGHCCYGILMGYYYSLVCFSSHHRVKNTILLFVAPILAHGIYDALLMVTPHLPTALMVVVFLVFMGFCYLMWRYCQKQLAKHKKEDMLERQAKQAAAEAEILPSIEENSTPSAE